MCGAVKAGLLKFIINHPTANIQPSRSVVGYHHQHVKIPAGTQLGPYEISGIIAAGGMGEVYRARDTRLNRDVALKVLPKALSSDASLRERLQREGRAISSLTHPHICTLYDVGQQDGLDYLVMEYIEGETVAKAIERGPLPLDRVVRYGSEIADAVAAAHRAGIVHRDLKPGNVMLTKSGVKVLDFGLATARAEVVEPSTATVARPLTQAGQILGTLPYMSPEQLRGAPVDSRTDIFSLGIILYEMATGRQAFEGARRDTLPAVQPPALDALIKRCLADDPERRVQSARDVEFTLNDIGSTRASRKPAAMAVAAAIAVVVTVTAWLVMYRKQAPALPEHRPNTIAVLPFANLGADHSHDYLKLAIPDEITTILTYNQDLAVRPFSASRLFDANADPQLAAKKLNAVAIVSGHVMDASGRLNVTLEAIDVPQDKLLWRDMFEVATTDVVAMRSELGTRIQTGLMPRLAGTTAVRTTGAPKNPDAYVLFLRAAALSTDGEPNRQALQLLHQAVAIEGDYAPTWAAISFREYSDATYGTGGPAAKERAAEAAARALQLDPDLAVAATRQIVMRTEAGDTVQAYKEAKRLLEKRPRNGDAHFNLSYVYRYGGALNESAFECDTAIALDPGNRLFRSCATTFAYLRNQQRANEFFALDPDSLLVRRLQVSEAMRHHDLERAISISGPPLRDLLVAVRDHAPADVLNDATQVLVRRAAEAADGESDYGLALLLAACSRTNDSLALLRQALARNFCTYPAMDTDPLLDSVRKLPEYIAIREQAIQCHQRFMAAIHQ
jgi:serine/threonine protein kinase